MTIGILSDTHSYVDDRILHHLDGVDLIIHAGDVGDPSVLNALEATGKLACVYGNIDNQEVRKRCPEHLMLELQGCNILLIHIAGAMGRYNRKTSDLIKAHQPDVLICGHSHLLKVGKVDNYNLLHINPGAAGRHGFHKIRTMIKMEIELGQPRDLRVIELGTRSAQTID